MGVRVVVVGIAGVGKSTVIDHVSKRLDGISVQVFGTVMFEEAKRLRWVKQRDEMRKMPVEKQKRLQKIAAQKLSKSKGRYTLVDTHLFIRTNEGFWPGLPLEVIKALKPTHLVLVEAAPDEILSRRMKDTTRYRDVITREEVDYELDLAKTLLASASLVSGAPMLIVRNEEGRAEEAAEAITTAIGGGAS